MAEYRTIKMSFWSDPFIEALCPEEKLLYLYLFTSQYTSTLGVCQVSQKKIAFETGLDLSMVREFITKFTTLRKLIIDGDNILIAKFIKHQCSTSEKVITYLRKEFEQIESQKIRDALAIIYPVLFADIHTVSCDPDTIWIPYEYPMHMVGGIKVQGTGYREQGTGYMASGSGENDSPRKTAEKTLPDEYFNLAKEFQEAVTASQVECAPKLTDKLIREGAAEIDKAIRIDGFDLEELKRALFWANKNSFWCNNLLSLAQMRKKISNGTSKVQTIVSQYRKSLIKKMPEQGQFMTKGELREANNRLAAERAEAMIEEQRRRLANGE